METINFFDNMEYLEPKCPKCKAVLEYGINTKFDEKKKTHICNSCGTLLR